jgi:LysM repeat protein
MVSRRRRIKLWPWAALVLLLAVGYGLSRLISGEPAAQALGDATAAETSANIAAAGVPAPRSTRDLTPPTVLGNPRSAPQPQTTTPANPPAAPLATAQTPAAPPPTTPSTPAPAANTTSPALVQGMDLIADGRVIEGRAKLSQLLFNAPVTLAPRDEQAIRDTLASVNQKLVFSKEIVAGDPLAESYVIQSGDLLARLAPRYKIPYQFVETINNTDARKLMVGQKIKMIKGPFHVRVVKHDYRLDVFLRTADGAPVYVCSYPVGLGEGNSTPEGHWIIEPGRKVKNPAWADPRSTRYFQADDPANPIGEYWLALKGADDKTANVRGYGIHGTIEPQSIGRQASMGCVRLRDKDIEQLFHMLYEGESTVEIAP